jgi:heme/copper-type cytochrome/quinol oxidase subunit 4
MSLPRGTKIILGIVTILCAFSPLLVAPLAFLPINRLPLFIGLSVLQMLLMVFYFVLLKVTPSSRVVGPKWLWVLVILFGVAWGESVFWYLNVWQEPLSPPNPSSAFD